MNALSTITILPSTKEEQKNYIALVKEAILSGEQNPLIIARQLNAFAGILKELTSDKDIKACFMDEAQKYGSKTFDLGAKFTLQNRKTYDYTNWCEISASIEALKLQLKEREEMLKHLTCEVADVETGEMLTPPPFESNEILVITLNK